MATTDGVIERLSYITWSSAIAGALVASALSFVLLTFGSAVGLTLISPWTSTASTAKWVGGLAVFWIVAQQIGSLLAGGYVAGRLRTRWQELSRDEIEFRDGMHGALTWAIAIIIGAMLAASAVGAVGRAATEVVGRAAQGAAGNVDPMSYHVDVLLRPNAQTSIPTGDPSAVRAEVARIFANAVASPNGLSQPDRTYLAQVVARSTGLPPQEAEARVTQVANEATRIAKEATDRARKSAVAAGFLTAASLLLSLGAAWWAAQRGGDHRDTSRAARFY